MVRVGSSDEPWWMDSGDARVAGAADDDDDDDTGREGG
jgi:hypothetical protein